MNYDKITLDAKSVRTVDKNGYLHVAISPLTKEQVAPYHGFEIPNYENLGFRADGTYYGYRPASELSKPETIESLNGIPIQYRHHIDSAENPAKNTRVGSTGTDGAFKSPYLTNSLHIQDEQAIKSINDGSLRELSLAYWYDPVKKSGSFNGQPYDFLMTNIRANHLALVEEGRAGSDVLVYDSKFNSIEDKTTMDENKEVCELLKKVVSLLEHKAEATDEKPEDEKADERQAAPAESAPKEEEKAAPEEVKEDETEELDFTDEDEDGDEGKAEETEETEEVDDSEDEDEKADIGIDADILDMCGMSGEPPEIQRAFAAGVRYGEKKEKAEPKKLDREHEREGEERYEDRKAAQDAAYDALNAKFAAKFDALENCRATLGSVKFAAFDSAEDVYAAAYKKETGKTIDPQFARVAYESYLSGKAQAKTLSPAQDAKSVDAEMESKVLAQFLD